MNTQSITNSELKADIVSKLNAEKVAFSYNDQSASLDF